MIRIISCIFAIVCLGGLMGASAQQAEPGAVSLTVYNTGAALIHEARRLELTAGLQTIALRDLAATYDVTSVSLRSLSDPAGIRVLEQIASLPRDSIRQLLEANLGASITVSNYDGASFSGELLSLEHDLALLQSGPLEIAAISLWDIRGLQLATMPDALHQGPALRLTLDSKSAGAQDLELRYLARGMTWTADYQLLLSEDSAALDLKGMVTLVNQTGKSFADAKLKLVAGGISRVEVEEERDYADDMRMYSAMPAVAESAPPPAPSDIAEFKVYAIARPLTVAAAETAQIEFIRADGIRARGEYVFDSSPNFGGYNRPLDYVSLGDPDNSAVRTFLEFSTGDEQGLGADLPAGRARVYQADAAGDILLIGEDTISHSPRGEDIRLEIGVAFDLLGSRRQTFFERRFQTIEERFEIRLSNRKQAETVEIKVPERLVRWSNWKITESSAPFVKLDQASIEFTVTLAPGQTETLTYTVEYTFPRDY